MPELPTTKELDQAFGARLRYFRLAQKMSQSDLGNEVGLTFQQIQKYEKGSNRISLSRLAQFSTTLRFSFEEFFEKSFENGAHRNPEIQSALELVGNSQTLDLLRSFSSIRKPDTKKTIVGLVKAIEKGQ